MAVDGGESFHRVGCAMAAGKEVDEVTAAAGPQAWPSPLPAVRAVGAAGLAEHSPTVVILENALLGDHLRRHLRALGHRHRPDLHGDRRVQPRPLRRRPARRLPGVGAQRRPRAPDGADRPHRAGGVRTAARRGARAAGVPAVAGARGEQLGEARRRARRGGADPRRDQRRVGARACRARRPSRCRGSSRSSPSRSGRCASTPSRSGWSPASWSSPRCCGCCCAGRSSAPASAPSSTAVSSRSSPPSTPTACRRWRGRSAARSARSPACSSPRPPSSRRASSSSASRRSRWRSSPASRASRWPSGSASW